jgi:hypothetical protein
VLTGVVPTTAVAVAAVAVAAVAVAVARPMALRLPSTVVLQTTFARF